MGTGGAERAVAAAATRLVNAGRDVRVLCLEEGPPAESLSLPFAVHRLSGSGSAGSPAVKLLALPVLAVRLARYVSREHAGVVMSHLFRANFVNVLARSLARSRHRVILVNHTRLGRLAKEGLQGAINWTLSRWLYPKADLVASVSTGASNECARLLGLPDGKSITLHDPIETPAPQPPGSAPPVDAIVGVGRLVGLKRFEDLIDAFALIGPDYPRLELRLVGNGPERLALERRAAACGAGDRIRFFGRIADPRPVVAGCAVFVSASETEGFGMAIVEALALGVPVVASDCAFGPREILAPGTDPMRLLPAGAGIEVARHGILYPVGSVERLAQALRTLLDSRDMRNTFAERGPGRAADFSADNATAEYERLLFPDDRHVVIAYNTCWYVYNFRLPLIRALIGKGWRVTVLAPRDAYSARVESAGAAHRHIDLDPRGMNPLRELATIGRFKKAYRELTPAVALQYTIKPDIYGSIAARSLGIPVINTITGLGTMFSGGLKERAVRALYRYAFAKADLVFFQNVDDQDLFMRSGIVRKERTALLPGSGVDTERFSPRPRGAGPFTFLLAARLLRAKGVEEFIAAARQVKARHAGTRFVLLGSHDPSDREYANAGLVSRSQEDGTIESPGHVDDIRPFLAAADCIVLPSYYREGIPRSLLEAASMGKPLIAADSVGTREPVRDGVNGFLCRPRDPQDLASKMELMLAMSREKLEEMGAASRRLAVETYDERIVVNACLEAVQRLSGCAEEPS
jgi:glycosyltransferase involved in cell wall biosynthesis